VKELPGHHLVFVYFFLIFHRKTLCAKQITICLNAHLTQRNRRDALSAALTPEKRTEAEGVAAAAEQPPPVTNNRYMDSIHSNLWDSKFKSPFPPSDSPPHASLDRGYATHDNWQESSEEDGQASSYEFLDSVDGLFSNLRDVE
jgi:hypothetical protein